MQLMVTVQRKKIEDAVRIMRAMAKLAEDAGATESARFARLYALRLEVELMPVVQIKRRRRCSICDQPGHTATTCDR